MKSCIVRASRFLQAIAVAGAIGLVAPPSAAWAQNSQGKKPQASAAASQPASVPGVVVQAPPKLDRVPPDKKAALDAQARKRKAWTTYRKTTPTPTAAASATAPATASASAKAENYPGLHDMASH
jgi:hypothetical protein